MNLRDTATEIVRRLQAAGHSAYWVGGCVRDLRSGELFSEPGQPIRLCVSPPQGDLTVDL